MKVNKYEDISQIDREAKRDYIDRVTGNKRI